ncbi:unnamed protein product [Cuscuta epithymum]|uniref:Pectinesterase inhibitor domain-containing protein n=1 Tax=Cuscuta epithymum TaxID=186058 RepID=A0AAV0E9Q7_9ASTE|nr:unnamed protein product [Cuscuta epithymum]CAH9128955.1 unnamed protein product [Cuscuta epithymum]
MKSSGTYNFHLVIIFFFTILAVVNSRPPAAAPAPQPATEPAESPEAFIEQCCNATKLVNPKTCYQLLSPHAPNIHYGNITKGAIELIGVALNLAMDETSAVKVTIEKLIKDFPKLLLIAIIDSLKKCAQLLGSSIDRIEQSVGKLQHLNMTSKADLQFQIGTVLTLVVNAETFEAQCTDALLFNALFSVFLQENNVTAPLNQSVTLTQTALALVAYTADHLI